MLPEMSSCAASAAQARRNAVATTAAPYTATATIGAGCTPAKRNTSAGTATANAPATFVAAERPSVMPCPPGWVPGGGTTSTRHHPVLVEGLARPSELSLIGPGDRDTSLSRWTRVD